MNSRALRRLAADRHALHSQPLPPNYLFPPEDHSNDNLTELDILLAGPQHTPFSAGLFHLHLSVPTTYPELPPTANFRTQIFHPNVDPNTGAVCVETLKRDWDPKLTLKDILVVISCLLIQPNPDSALNAEAGALIQESYDAFARRAEMMTGIHARVPDTLKEAVRAAQSLGNTETTEEAAALRVDIRDFAGPSRVVGRRRRLGASIRQRGNVGGTRRDGSPAAMASRRTAIELSTPGVADDALVGDNVQSSKRSSDVFMGENTDQENDSSRTPPEQPSPRAGTPRRPNGIAIPLGELEMDDPLSSCDEDEGLEPEYPPSPRKSPSKSPRKQLSAAMPKPMLRPESSRTSATRNITPANICDKPLANDSPYAPFTDLTPSPRKAKVQQQTRRFSPVDVGTKQRALSPKRRSPREATARINKRPSPPPGRYWEADERRAKLLRDRLLGLCGGDIDRYNRGDFDGDLIPKKAPRW